MRFLKHLGFLGLASGLLLAVELGGERGKADAQVTGLRVSAVSDAAVTAPVRTAYGKVTSIAGRVLRLNVGGHDMTFVADDKTDVLARGADRATRTAAGGAPITDLVRAGDMALVAYRESKGSMRALEIQVKGRTTIAAR